MATHACHMLVEEWGMLWRLYSLRSRLCVEPCRETRWCISGGEVRGRGGVQQESQTVREVTFQSDGVNGLGLDDGAGMQPDRASVILSITLSCHLYTIFLAALGPPRAALRARKSEIGIARRPVILRSRLWAVARHLMGVEGTGQAVVHA